MSSSVLGICVAALAAICWGFVYATSQRLVKPGRFTSAQLLSGSFYAGSLVLFPVLLYHRTSLTQAEQDATSFFGFLVTLIASEYLVFYSVQLLGGTEASLVQVSYPVWTALWLFVTNGEVPSRLTILGGLPILGGVVFLTLNGGNHELNDDESTGREGDTLPLGQTTYSTVVHSRPV